ncbi:hypothetical protein E2C01_055298 [Portunus trituberculatus]|uniref:Uncharacterized protein n=1 Tax=Portunus trituberculatus TaxID=210409 RepID=A0A5B7GMD2_PORTR|nr:hypothetical protein [Portunus trituberculatus]
MLQKLMKNKLREESRHFGLATREQSDLGHFWSPPQKRTPKLDLELPFFCFLF